MGRDRRVAASGPRSPRLRRRSLGPHRPLALPTAEPLRGTPCGPDAPRWRAMQAGTASRHAVAGLTVDSGDPTASVLGLTVREPLGSGALRAGAAPIPGLSVR